MLKLDDTNKLKEYADSIRDYPNGLHQGILDLAYRQWRSNDDWHYRDMVKWIKTNYGNLAAFAVLIGKYNQQVENGGHQQYFDNGFESGIGGLGNQNSKECPLHEEMLDLFTVLGFSNYGIGEEVFEIAALLRVTEADADDWDSPNDWPVVTDSDYLDDRYYKINEQWMDFFEESLRLKLL